MTPSIPDRFVNITPSDTAPINPLVGLYVGGAGTVVAVGVDGVSASFVCPAGTYLRGRFTLVKATGTTATNIVGLLAH